MNTESKDRVTEILLESGYTIQAVAAQIGMSHSSLSQVLNGKRPLSYKQLVLLLRWHQGAHLAEGAESLVEALVGLAPPMVQLAWSAKGKPRHLLDKVRRIDPKGL